MRAIRSATLLLVVSSMLLGATTCVRLNADPMMSALAGQDLTAMIEGCGNQLVSGYTFCRKVEGDASKEEIYLVAPAAKCNDEKSCVEWKIFYPDGSGPVGGTFPLGQSRVAVKWKQLLNRDTFELGDGGFWGVRYIIKWIDQNGYPKQTTVDGEIRLIVHRKGYLPLNAASEDPAFVWSWQEGAVAARMTTGGRAYVGAK